MNAIGQLFKVLGWDRYLEDMAKRVDRNVPRHSEPDKFHEEKSEIKNCLMKMSKGENP